MTATGSHKDFEFAARSTTLQGKPLLCPISCSADFHCSSIAGQRAGYVALQSLAVRFYRLRKAYTKSPQQSGVFLLR